jgi:hypothetical protein
MSVVKMVASRYRRISTLENCVTFVIFPAAAASALRPAAPLLSFPTDAASSANVRGSMLRASLDSRQLDVVSLARTFTSPGAHCSDFPRLTLRRSSFRCGPWEWQGDEIHAVVEAEGKLCASASHPVRLATGLREKLNQYLPRRNGNWIKRAETGACQPNQRKCRRFALTRK